MKSTIRPKKCKICESKFTPERPLQQVCGFECAIHLLKDNKVKKIKIDVKEAKL